MLPVPFNETGVNQEDTLVMCLNFNYNVAKAQKHPLTLEQELKNKEYKPSKEQLKEKNNEL